jgi:endoglucanase
MNEPAGISPQEWLGAANAGMGSIRQAGAANLVLVPGVAYTGAHSWISAGNGLMREIVDPGGNFAFEVHQYLDRDSSGTSPTAMRASIGSERIRAFQAWARENRFKALLGEFGAAGDELSLEALQDLCRTMEANSDVWIGWAAWAGGAWWPGNYMFNLEPLRGGRMREQTRILADYARRVQSG